MKMKTTLLITLILNTCISDATQFFALNHTKNGKIYSNQLVELNDKSGAVSSTINLSNSYKYSTQRLLIPNTKHMFFFNRIDKKTGTLDIALKSDIKNLNTLTIDALNQFLIPGVGLYTFKHLTSDSNYLFLHTGHKKNQHITIIDVNKGVVSKKIPISRNRNSIAISSDQKYMLVNNTSKDQLTVINLSSFEIVMTSKLGNYRKYAIIHDDHLYLTKFKSIKQNKFYWIQSLNLKSKEKTDFTEESTSEPIFAVSPNTHQLMSIITTDQSKTTQLLKIKGNESQTIGSYQIRTRPVEMIVDEDLNQILLKGKAKIITINLKNLSQYTSTKLPFDAVKYGYNNSGDLLYLKEGSGSEVAVVDVKTGNLIERSGTGRKGVKFGQFMASVALAGVGLNYGYSVYFAKYSNTGFTLNHDENKLYVINSKTNDVTHFNANDLSDRKAISTGGSTFLVHQGNAKDAPLWVFSGHKVNQINDQKFELEKEITYEQIIGFDMDKDYFIVKTEHDIQTYDMKTGTITNQWPTSSVKEVWTE